MMWLILYADDMIFLNNLVKDLNVCDLTYNNFSIDLLEYVLTGSTMEQYLQTLQMEK